MEIERLTQAMTAAVRSDMKDLTPRQLAILLNLNEGSQSVRGIAAKLNIGKPAVTRATQTLIGYGFMTKNRVDGDHRDRSLDITDAGRNYCEQYRSLLADTSYAMAA